MNMYYRRSTKRDKIKHWYGHWKPLVWIVGTVLAMLFLAFAADAQEQERMELEADLRTVNTGIKCAAFFSMVARSHIQKESDYDEIIAFAITSTGISLHAATRYGEKINVNLNAIETAYEAEVAKLISTPQVEANEIIAVATKLCKSYVIAVVDEFGEELGIEIIQE